MMRSDAARSRHDVPRVSPRGMVLTALGVVIGGVGYYASWRYQTAIGTLGGILGLALCVLGTSKAHEE